METTTVTLLTNVGFAVIAILFTGFAVAAAGFVLTLLAKYKRK